MLPPLAVKYLVFSGGGVRGYSYVGVLQELAAQGVDLPGLKGGGGTSIGALMAALLLAGWTPAELEVELLSVHAKDKIDLSLTSLLTKFGLDTGETLVQYINMLLFRATRCDQLTFEQLFLLRGKRLLVNACDLKCNEELVFDVDRTPHVSIAAAVQMSMAVPGLFAPVQWNDKLVVDGGIKNNFPLHHFPSGETLGVRVTWPTASHLKSVDQVLARAIYCILTDAEEVQWRHLGDKHRANTIHVEVGDLATIELHLSLEQKRGIMHKGVLAVRRAFTCSEPTATYTQVLTQLLLQVACNTHTQKVLPP